MHNPQSAQERKHLAIGDRFIDRHAAVAEDQAPDAFQSSAPETATVIVGVTHNAAMSAKANPGRCGLSSRRFLLISA